MGWDMNMIMYISRIQSIIIILFENFMSILDLDIQTWKTSLVPLPVCAIWVVF